VALRLRAAEGQVLAELCNEARPAEAQSRGLSGLDAVRRLVEMLGGSWRGAEMTPEGCIYRFALVAAPRQERTLLVVEDNEGIIRAFQRYASSYGYRIVGATSGTEALRLARELDPTAVTLDVLMPGQDGWEVLQALKRDPATRHIPVIICSVLVDPDLARALGAAAYVPKPVTQDALLAALASLARPPA
jgi:CheY-like chemotaxis protein